MQPARAGGDDKRWNEPIAIIGMHGRFPGADSLECYWRNLALGRDCVGPAPKERLRAGANPAGVAQGGFLDAIDAFDAAFFGISEHEARLMDPLQRLLLESAWSSMEEAGYRASDLARAETGVFVATGKSDYEELLYRADVAPDAKFATGVASAIIANRISFSLGLMGPSVTVDTACSGSLAALHLAAQSIRSGDCAMALVGAANLMLSPTLSRSLQEEGALSADCRTRSFDAAAKGYARGEGVASLLLKRLSAADADRDPIHGVLIGSAICHGGRANWLTAPNALAQKELVAKAWRRADIDPRTITYIEAHGTGTPLGDPIEFTAIRQAYEELTRNSPDRRAEHRCAIGSVKANIGHLEAAAGLAGIVKVLLAMKHGEIPGNPLLETANPLCKTQGSPFYFVRQTETWANPLDAAGGPMPRRAGVSAFGFGGACGHVVLEEHCASKAGGDEADAQVLKVLPISAKDEDGLRRYALELRDFAAAQRQPAGATIELADFLYTFQVGRTPLPARLIVMAASWSALEVSLANFIAGRDDPNLLGSGVPSQPFTASGDELTDLSAQFARQWVEGRKIDFASLYGARRRRRIAAPTYPFARSRYWFQDEAAPEGRPTMEGV
ncbi:MAG: hypothetical protein JO234_12350 [Hyphomicrobiales bacterium]|nr:hypothetical protein [Hyphomicrobiales bacterium]